jgi:predicted transcriptional regulator
MTDRILKKELIQKKDGRYLYLYSWSKDKPVKGKKMAKERRS